MEAHSRAHKTALLGAGFAITILAGVSSYAALVGLKVVAVREDVRQRLWTSAHRLWAAGEARAEEAPRAFHIAAQPLANALVVFSEQSGMAVMAPAELVRDKTAPAVEGTMPPFTALDRLLKDSGLKYSRSAEGTLLIVPAGSTKAIERRPPAPPAAMAPNGRITVGRRFRGSLSAAACVVHREPRRTKNSGESFAVARLNNRQDAAGGNFAMDTSLRGGQRTDRKGST